MAWKCCTCKLKKPGVSGTAFLSFFVFLFFSCKPADKAADLKYIQVSTSAYSLAIPPAAHLKETQSDNSLSKWHILYLDSLDAELYLTYTRLGAGRSLNKLIEDADAMAIKHARFATALDRQSFSDRANHVSGSYFRITGESASPIQFYATDSTRNWLRGALYFTQSDSSGTRTRTIEPVIKKMIGSLRWKTPSDSATLNLQKP
ncbi:hypothetical protein [Pedobacter sp. SYP-B3415]|uniref:hypothetical protein n=1 Tax=Pedobacter sp. SYP-B3415 TaxID=2496641 RepID=UPI00101BB127|nr:hypothetical protein [Pedobacter sp. SYP-B3415]